MLYRVSAAWAKVELFTAALLAVCVTCLVLLNVLTRNIGQSLFWVDELAIYAMVWMTFMGASAALHYRNSVSITLLSDAVSPSIKLLIDKTVDVIILVFSLSMLWFCWRWFLPLDIFQAGFDAQSFQGSTFNFIYSEPTLTLGLPKFLFWLVVWLFAIGATLHSLTHLFSRRTAETVL